MTKNSTSFKPGESGNPNGRPKNCLGSKTLIQQVWNEEIKDANGDKRIEGLLAIKAMFKKAKRGDVGAFRVLVERMEGMPKQEVDLNTTIVEMPRIKKDGKEVNFGIGTTANARLTGEAAEDSRSI